MKISILIGVIYIIGAIITYIITAIMTKNSSDSREFELSHIGVSIAFPIFWFIIGLIYVCYIFEIFFDMIDKNRKGK